MSGSETREARGSEHRIRPYRSLQDWASTSPTGRFESENVSVMFISDHPYALETVTSTDVISLKLGQTKGRKAWNTDKLTEMNVLPGHALVFPRGSRVFSDADVASSFPILSISKSFRQDVVSEFGRAADIPFDRVYEGLQSPAFLPLAQSIRGMLMGSQFGGKLAADAIGVTVLTEVMRVLTRWDPAAASRGLNPKRLRLVLNYIDDELGGDLSTKTLAALAGLSAFHFTRAFKEATGGSPHQYVLERRLARARQLLENGAMPLAEIAYDVGFSSQAHMSTVFTKRMGIAPGRYRKARRE